MNWMASATRCALTMVEGDGVSGLYRRHTNCGKNRISVYIAVGEVSFQTVYIGLPPTVMKIALVRYQRA